MKITIATKVHHENSRLLLSIGNQEYHPKGTNYNFFFLWPSGIAKDCFLNKIINSVISVKIEVEGNIPAEEKAQIEEDVQEEKEQPDNEPWSVQNALQGVAGIGGTIGLEKEQ